MFVARGSSVASSLSVRTPSRPAARLSWIEKTDDICILSIHELQICESLDYVWSQKNHHSNHME